jgi:cytochrome P450
VIVSPYAIQRHPDHFSAPDRFQPERWLDNLAKRLPRFAYFPFGGGPRVCIGNHFASLEAGLLLGSLIQEVSLEVPGDFRMEPVPVVTLRSRHGLPVTVSGKHGSRGADS